MSAEVLSCPWLIWRRSGSVVGGIDMCSVTGMFGPLTLCPPVQTRHFHALYTYIVPAHVG